FVYYNILQKKAVCDSVKFKVKATHQREIVQRILNIDRLLLENLIRKFDRNKQYLPETIEERDLLNTINRVSTVTRDLPGTTGYKIRMRNEIRSLVNFLGTPAFFITLNPSDVNHPLVRLLAGKDVSLEHVEQGEELSEWRRRLVVAEHPAACAKFFHTMISSFL
ncbi:hypothetical protein C8Q76DRAFT_597651, partial [Earliella scabrosa]